MYETFQSVMKDSFQNCEGQNQYCRVPKGGGVQGGGVTGEP